MDVYNLVYLLFTCWDYGGAYGRISLGIPTVYVLGLRWRIWTYIIWYTYCLRAGITVAHMDVYNLVYLLFTCWDYGGAYGRIQFGIPTV